MSLVGMPITVEHRCGRDHCMLKPPCRLESPFSGKDFKKGIFQKAFQTKTLKTKTLQPMLAIWTLIWVLIVLVVASPAIYAYSLGLDIDKVHADFGELTPEGSPYIFPCAAELSVISTLNGWSISTRAEGNLAASGLPGLPVERLKWAFHSSEGTPVWMPFTESDTPVLVNQPATSTKGRAIPLDYRLDISWQDPLTTPTSGPYKVNLVYTASPGYLAMSYASPNPFNPEIHGNITIGFYVPGRVPPVPELAGISIFDASGNLASKITGNMINPNTWDSFAWNGTGISGESLPDGTYTYVIATHAGRWLASGLIIIDRTASAGGEAGAASISGTVRDSISGAGLASAGVRLYKASGRQVSQARAGEGGIFTFSGIPQGRYFIEGRHEGYIPSRTREFYVETAGAISRNIELRPNTDIFVGATLSPGIASAGDIVTLTVHVKNMGPELFNNVVVKVAPARGLYYLASTSRLLENGRSNGRRSNGGSGNLTEHGNRQNKNTRATVTSPQLNALVRSNGATLEWLIGALPPGEQRTLVCKVAVGMDARMNARESEPSIVTRVSACGYSPTRRVDSIPVTAPLRVARGVVSPDGTIVGHLFHDANGDGQRQPAEEPIKNAAVMLEDGSTARTDNNGIFVFRNVVPGTHALQLQTGDILQLRTADPGTGRIEAWKSACIIWGHGGHTGGRHTGNPTSINDSRGDGGNNGIRPARNSMFANVSPGGTALVDFAITGPFVAPETAPEPEHGPEPETKPGLRGLRELYALHARDLHDPCGCHIKNLFGLASIEATFPTGDWGETGDGPGLGAAEIPTIPIKTRLALDLGIAIADTPWLYRGIPQETSQTVPSLNNTTPDDSSQMAPNQGLGLISHVSLDTAKPGAGIAGELQARTQNSKFELRFGEFPTQGGSIRGGIGSYRFQSRVQPWLTPTPSPESNPESEPKPAPEPTPDTQLTVFHGLRSTVRQHDLIKGANISGPYQLKQGAIIPGTEEISLEVRPRDGGGIIERRSDILYSIDYDRGILTFEEIIPEFDVRGNPVYINASYEFRPASVDKGGISGIGVAARLNGGLTGGAVYVWGASTRDENAAQGAAQGMDAAPARALLTGISLRPSDVFQLAGRYAITSSPAASAASCSASGFTPGLTSGSAGSTGSASIFASGFDIRADLNLPPLTGSIAYRALEPGFDRDNLLGGIPEEFGGVGGDINQAPSWGYSIIPYYTSEDRNTTKEASLSLMYDLPGDPAGPNLLTNPNRSMSRGSTSKDSDNGLSSSRPGLSAPCLLRPALSLGYKMKYVEYAASPAAIEDGVEDKVEGGGTGEEEIAGTTETTESIVATASCDIASLKLQVEAETGNMLRYRHSSPAAGPTGDNGDGKTTYLPTPASPISALPMSAASLGASNSGSSSSRAFTALSCTIDYPGSALAPVSKGAPNSSAPNGLSFRIKIGSRITTYPGPGHIDSSSTGTALGSGGSAHQPGCGEHGMAFREPFRERENTLELQARKPLRPWLAANLVQRWEARRGAHTSLTALGLDVTPSPRVTAAMRYEMEAQNPAAGPGSKQQGQCDESPSNSTAHFRDTLRVKVTAKDSTRSGIEARIEGSITRSRKSGTPAPAPAPGYGTSGTSGISDINDIQEPCNIQDPSGAEVDLSAAVEYIPSGSGDLYASASLGYRLRPDLERRSFARIEGAAHPTPRLTLSAKYIYKLVEDLEALTGDPTPEISKGSEYHKGYGTHGIYGGTYGKTYRGWGNPTVLTTACLARADYRISRDVALAGEYRLASQIPTQGSAANLCLETILDRWDPFRVIIGYASLRGEGSIAPEYLRPEGFYLNLFLGLSH
ncbi:MAG: hypothetical protein HPY71_15745 [Firmicutes bacterium]|nr:hypothetical protein [Bacillota bacterium]